MSDIDDFHAKVLLDMKWGARMNHIIDAWIRLSPTNSIGSHPMVAFVERSKAKHALDVGAWMQVTDPETIEYAKANWKPHPAQDHLVTCDPNDPARVDVICVVLPQV